MYTTPSINSIWYPEIIKQVKIIMNLDDRPKFLFKIIKAVMPSVPWQRCQFHLQQNAQSYITKKS
jgi:transposase-like protein